MDDESEERTRKTKNVDYVMGRDDTEGSRVKSRGMVLKVFSEKVKKGVQPNMNCRVETVGRIVGSFCETKKQWVRDMGLGGLLYLRGKRLPRNLCYWLMTRLDPVERRLVIDSRLQFPLRNSQVHWVLGTPHGPKKVPCHIANDQMKRCVDDVWEKFGVISKCGTKYIPMVKVIDRVERPCGLADEVDFKIAFLVVALCLVLCPTTCHRLAKDLLPAVTVAMDASSYDWSSLVMDKLIESSRTFANRFYRDGYAKGCGGCTYFLAIFYLDRLNRSPLSWGIFPRLKVWTIEEVNKARAKDKHVISDGVGDFGFLGCIDIAYGESHPRDARDSMGPRSIAAEVSTLVLEGMGIKWGVQHEMGMSESEGEGHWKRRRKTKKERRKGPADKSNPYTRKKAKKDTGKSENGREEGYGDSNNVNENSCEGERSREPCPSEGKMSNDLSNSNGKAKVDWEKTVIGLSAFADQEQTGLCGGEVFCKYTFGGNEELGHVFPENSGNKSVTGEKSPCGQKAPFEDKGHNEDKAPFEEKTPCEVKDPCEDKVSYEEKSCDDNAQSENKAQSEHKSQSVDNFEGVGNERAQKKIDRSRRKRGTRPAIKLNDDDFVVDAMPRPHPNNKVKLVKFVSTVGAILRDESAREISEKTQEDVTMLKCDHMYATVLNCYSVLSPCVGGVDDNYVRVAAALYTKMWKAKYGEGSIRYMVDPTFSLRILQAEGPINYWSDCWRLAKTYAKSFVNVPAVRFHVVFVPILQSNHWWCAAMSVNTEEVWVIDSLKRNPMQHHRFSIDKLCMGMDIFFSTVDSSWEIGKITSWPRKLVNMELQNDGSSCGVRMLLAIKACASRFTTEFKLRSPIDEERGWLLNEDFMSDQNEEKLHMKEVIQNSDLV